MSSGVAVSDEVKDSFNDIKLGHKYKYILYKISDNLKEIVVDKLVEESTYQEFVDNLPKADARYIVYDFDYTTTDGRPQNKLVFIVWCPNAARIKIRMLCASSKDAIKKTLVGVQREVQANDISELEWDAVHEKISRGGAA